MSNHNLNSLNPMKFLEMPKKRIMAIEKASDQKPHIDKFANVLANRLHPKIQHLIVDSIVDEYDAKRYILKADPEAGTNELAYFQSGQYISVEVEIDGRVYNRPYSICSSPFESLAGIYEILVKRVPNGVVSNYILDNFEVGTKMNVSAPDGNFTYEELRDQKHIVAVAGGSGITPFISFARTLDDNDVDYNLTIFYGCKTEEEFLFKKELDMYSYTHPKIDVVYVLSEEEKSPYEHGFITAEIIKKYVKSADYSIFICGPEMLHKHLDNEMKKLQIEAKNVRHEVFSSSNDENETKTFNVKIHQKGEVKNIKCLSNETLLHCFEVNRIKAISKCRSGECGFCHSKLISGEVVIPEKQDRRRLADDIYGYIHPCCSYPASDIEIEIN